MALGGNKTRSRRDAMLIELVELAGRMQVKEVRRLVVFARIITATELELERMMGIKPKELRNNG